MEGKKTTEGQPQVGSDALLAMLEATALDLWRASLCATKTEMGKQLFERMKNPKVGDVVMEITSYRRIKTDRMGFGKLISKTEGNHCGTEWVIETPDGKRCKWTNADIIAIPCGTFDWYPTVANDKIQPTCATGGSTEGEK